jgi:WD repeat-containing protein 35
MAVIDTNAVLKVIDLTVKNQRDDLANFKRNDVWSVMWAEDNPEMFVSMEKTKMHIFRDTHAGDPINCAGYLCSFADLQVRVLFLDEVMNRPDAPTQADIANFDTKALRNTRNLLDKVDLYEATQFIEQNPHQRLWYVGLILSSGDKQKITYLKYCKFIGES